MSLCRSCRKPAAATKTRMISNI